MWLLPKLLKTLSPKSPKAGLSVRATADGR